MGFRNFTYYLALAYDKLRKENKGQEYKITSKKLVETTWYMYFLYEENVAKEKASKILNNLELV